MAVEDGNVVSTSNMSVASSVANSTSEQGYRPAAPPGHTANAFSQAMAQPSSPTTPSGKPIGPSPTAIANHNEFSNVPQGSNSGSAAATGGLIGCGLASIGYVGFTAATGGWGAVAAPGVAGACGAGLTAGAYQGYTDHQQDQAISDNSQTGECSVGEPENDTESECGQSEGESSGGESGECS